VRRASADEPVGYIAAINIEAAFHQRHGGDYRLFPGIVLTDTFQLAETPTEIDALMFPENHERAGRQKAQDIGVIIGNPPYSVGQSSQNDSNQNLKYPTADTRIDAAYAERSSATSGEDANSLPSGHGLFSRGAVRADSRGQHRPQQISRKSLVEGAGRGSLARRQRQ
jgi:hypothetical protein